jgi:hypothetical protein
MEEEKNGLDRSSLKRELRGKYNIFISESEWNHFVFLLTSISNFTIVLRNDSFEFWLFPIEKKKI